MTATPFTPAPTAAEPERAVLARLVDRDEITRLVHQVGPALDEGRFDDLREIYTDDAVARTPGGVAEGIDALVAQASRNHAPENGIQHVVSGVLVDVDSDGDRATVRANLVVVFARRDPSSAPPTPFGPEPPTVVGEVYRFTARRTADGWRLASVATEPVWVSFQPLTVVDRPVA